MYMNRIIREIYVRARNEDSENSAQKLRIHTNTYTCKNMQNKARYSGYCLAIKLFG